MRKLKISCLFFLFLFLMGEAYCQEKIVVRGRIMDMKAGDPVIGSNIMEYDSQKRIITGTISDVNGNFVLKVTSADAVIVISCIGYKAQEFVLGAQRILNIDLEPDNIQLDEVVITHEAVRDPLTNLLERDRTNSTARIDMSESNHIAAASAGDVLQGKVSGMDIMSVSGNPGSGSSIVIRGLGSLGNSSPLIVVDGIPQQVNIGSDFSFSSADQEDIGDLVNIAPQDIKSIDVLKDAASTALWGSEGADGVLLIETYRGSKGKTKFDYQAKYTLTQQPSPIPMLNGDEYIMMQLEEQHNAQGLFTVPDEIAYDKDYVDFHNYSANTDWIDAISRDGFINDQYFKLSGGGEKTAYFTSLNYQKNEGTTINTSLQRVSTRINLDYNVSKRLRFSTNFSYTNSYKEDNYSLSSNIREMAYRKSPNMSVWEYDSEGNPTGEYFTPIYSYQGNGTTYYNPVAIGNLSENDTDNNNVHNSFQLIYNAFKWLKFRETISFSYYNTKRNQFLPANAIGADWINGSKNEAAEFNQNATDLMTRTQLFFTPSISTTHSLSASLMWETDQNASNFNYLKNDRSPTTDIKDPAANSILDNINSGSSESRTLGGLMNVNYKLMDRYIASLNLRADGSSKFGSNKRWGLFPSMSFGWRFSNEKWLRGLSMLNEGKIRVSYGQTGRQPSNAYDRHALYNTVDPNQYISHPIILPQQVQLTNLKWQTVSSWDLGIDLILFHDRINITGDIYDKKTTDLLWKSYDIPNSSGYETLKWFNGGELSNKGWELYLSYRPVDRKDLQINLNFNISRNINTFMSFPDNFNNEVETTIGNGQFPRRAEIGEPVGSFYGFKYLGVWPTDGDVKATNSNGEVLMDLNGNPIPFTYQETYKFQGGDAIYQDINHDGKIDIMDVVYLGDSNPEFIGGFGSTVNYKRFRLSMQFQYRTGYEIVNEVAINTEGMIDKNNQSLAVLHRWRKQGQDDPTTLPRAYLDHPCNNLGSNRYVESGDFLRLNTISMSYSLNKELCKRIGFRSIDIAINMRKILTITNYSGQDPEVSQQGDDPFWFGTDSARTPPPRMYTFSLNVGF